VMAQAVMTSTHGHPRLTWPVGAKVNISRPFIKPKIISFENFLISIHLWSIYTFKNRSKLIRTKERTIFFIIGLPIISVEGSSHTLEPVL